MVGILRDQNVRKQPRSGQSALDRTRRRRRLHDALTRRAGELRAHVLDHPEARRHVFENVGEILADLAHRRAAIRARAGGRMFDARARQVFR
jgi:hypothetical protein